MKTTKKQMAKKVLQVGRVYSVKVAGSYLPVRIDKALGKGRYRGVSMPGGKAVLTHADAARGDGTPIEQWKARQSAAEAQRPQSPEAKAGTPATPATAADVGPRSPIPVKPTNGKPPAAAGGQAAKAAKPGRRPSGLDAAAKVLAEAKAPMACTAMVERMLKGGLWSTGGKTPAATIYAAIIREIAKKGAASRFRKTGPGTFAANG